MPLLLTNGNCGTSLRLQSYWRLLGDNKQAEVRKALWQRGFEQKCEPWMSAIVNTLFKTYTLIYIWKNKGTNTHFYIQIQSGCESLFHS